MSCDANLPVDTSHEPRIIHGTRSFDHEEFLQRPPFAHLATVAGPAVPRESPVWFLYEDGGFWIIGDTKTDTFPVRVANNPACALGIVDFDRTSGLVQHVAVRGTASLQPFEPERARRIFRKYFGGGEYYTSSSVTRPHGARGARIPAQETKKCARLRP